MTSIIKKSYKMGKAVYATVNEVMNEPSHKTSTQQGHQTYYPPAHIPGQYTAQGQHPPALPPRPASNANAPNTQGYNPAQGYGSPQGYPSASNTPPVNPTYTQNQTGHSLSPGPTCNHQPGYSPPYKPQPSPSPTPIYPHVQTGPQINGTIPAAPYSAPPQTNWSPPSPMPTYTASFAPNSPYTPPTPSNAPTQAFPPQPSPSLSTSSTVPPQQPVPQQYTNNITHAQTQSPMGAPAFAQPYGPPQHMTPVSPIAPPANLYNGYPNGQPAMHSPSPPFAINPYSSPPMNPASPPSHVQSPVSPGPALTPQVPHPPAFVAELPGYMEPSQNISHHVPHSAPPSTYNSTPEGYSELPAELPCDPPAKHPAETSSSHPQTGGSLHTGSTTAGSHGTSVAQPTPIHPSLQEPVAPRPPAAYTPQTYSPAQTAPSPTAGEQYHPYQPAHVNLMPEHAPPTKQPPSMPNSQPGSYMPYAPPPQHQYGSPQYHGQQPNSSSPTLPQYSGASYQGQQSAPPPQHMSPALTPPPSGMPSRMGSLAQKMSQMNMGEAYARQ